MTTEPGSLSFSRMRTPIATSLVVLSLLVPSPRAPAQELAPEAILAGVEALYDRSPTGPRAPGYGLREEDAHLLVRRAHRLLDEGGDPEVRARLEALLAPPPEVHQAPGAPRAPGRDGLSEFRSAHFRVLYATSGGDAVTEDADGSGVPDKVEWVSQAFEAAYAREVQGFGYPSPPDIPNYTVVLKKLKVNALTHPESGGRTWCEFNHAMREGQGEAAIRQKFRAVAAHEFFHACQALMNWDEADWWVEGSADWMSERVDPGNGFFRSNAALRLERPEVGLESSEPYFPYAGSLFAAYLTTRGGDDRDLLKETWMRCGALRRADGGKRRVFIKQAVADVVGDFDEVVTSFWPHVYLRNFPSGQKLPRATRVQVKAYPATVRADTLPRPERYGANFFEFHPAAGHEQDTLLLRLTPENPKASLGVRVVVLGEKWQSVPVPRGEDGSYQARVHGLGSNWRAATLSVVNLGSKQPFSITAAFE